MKTPNNLQQAINSNHGMVQTDDGFVFMSMNVFREMMGVGTDEELQASLAAIERGIADMDAGRVRPWREVFAELGNKHAV